MEYILYNSNSFGDMIDCFSLSKIVLTAPEFSAGRTYVYKYETLLLGGLPEEGLAKAGLKVSSKVLISAAAENMYMLKVKIKSMFKKQSFYF